jgi:hypothetical protein
MLHAQEPHERRHRDFKPGQPLSIAQIIARGSVDLETAALVWTLLERGASLTVAGATEPRPGAGKSTTVQALLPFLPEGSALAFMSGRYETFAFTRLPDVDPTTTYAVCNEISDHQSTYMWGATARRYLLLPAQGYRIVTTVHADTLDDVLHLYRHDLLLRVEDLRRLGLVVNLGLSGSGRGEAQQRRWLSTAFLPPRPDPGRPGTLAPLLLSCWHESDGVFRHADQSVLDDLAEWTGLGRQDFTAAIGLRVDCLRELVAAGGASQSQVQAAIGELRGRDSMLGPLKPLPFSL